ncbi:Cytochrome P450 82G1 [Hibiscus syriacus]|uniref:Cytochrome P450 82G1 n=1 Tax=Hibiscus syriacus TaxID=106335 RepID=A0A6A2WTY3_HIBSY|nr:dimethylnonatriene synthase-like [Hibiscus syriacus]KAE8664833.1 Cytochrome P450 82G1 [Hibiscus syriacus]
MDLYTFLQSIASLLMFLYIFSKLTPKNPKKNGIPEPAGSLPLIGHLHLLSEKETACKKLATMADKCGPLFSLKLGIHRVLVVSSWEIAKDCFTTNDLTLATRANTAGGRHMGYNNAIFALAPYGEYWRNIRKMVTIELLSSHRLEKLKHIRFSEMDYFIKDLYDLSRKGAENCAEMVTISEALEQFTFNIILRMLVGKRFSGSTCADKNSEPWRYEKAIKKAIYLFGVFMLADALPGLGCVDIQGHIRSMKRTAKEVDSLISAWLDEHLKRRKENQDTCESDFMDVMLNHLPEETVISGHTRDTIVKATTMILTLTGGESTSVTITWALSLLLNHPNVVKAAREELEHQVGTERWVEESDIKNLKYLQAIVKETLRLYPPGPITGIREATQDCRIAGYDVSKGTRLIVNIWKLHRDPRVWENADLFQPERFMTTHAHLDVRGQNFVYMPFSSGRRSCPGMTFGLQVVHLTVAKLIQGFDIRTIDGMAVDMEEGLGLALPKLNPLEVVLTPRLHSELYEGLQDIKKY